MEIPRMIISEHHRGHEMPISAVLSALAGQEGCDDFECDVMQAASEYIDELELFITNLIIEKGRFVDGKTDQT